MDVDTLHTLVSSAIWRAEQLDESRVRSANAWAEVSQLEEELANALPVSEPEGRIARRGAVRAALKAEEYARAEALVQRYLAEKAAPRSLREELRKMLGEDAGTVAGRYPYAAKHRRIEEAASIRRPDLKHARVHPSSSPDLEIVVRRVWSDGREHLHFELTAADPDLGIKHQRFDSKPFERAPAAYVEELLLGIADLPLVLRNDPAAIANQLSAIGAALTDRFMPPDLEARLWSLRGRVETVQIHSDESFIPWELAKLRGPVPDSAGDQPYLCEAFAVARWLVGFPRETRLPLRHVATVVPRDGNVGKATPELEALLRQADTGRVVEGIPALAASVVEALASGHYDGWYFAAHGEAKDEDPERWDLRLENYQKLPARMLEGRVDGLGEARPLVFMNSCRSGRSNLALTGTGAWSSAFVRAGAGAFIGCNWAVDDQKAHEFAREFYRFFAADGLPLAKALRQARLWLRYRYPGDPTWLAYTLFGHPGAEEGAVVEGAAQQMPEL